MTAQEYYLKYWRIVDPQTGNLLPPTLREHDKALLSQTIVRAKYPDAYARKYAALSMVIWCPMLNCRLSGFFHTEQEAWDNAVEWILKKEKTTP